MGSLDGKQQTGVKYTFEAWSESSQRHREGAPSIWSVYSFDTLKEAEHERARLEDRWSIVRWKKKWGARSGNMYAGFEIYRVETTHVPRRKRR